MDTALKIKTYILKNVAEHPTDIVSRAAKHYGVSRQTAHKHIKALVDAGEIVQTGTRKGTRYFLKAAKNREFSLAVTPGLREDEVWTERLEPLVKSLSENVRRICYYGFTEMFNNVIDHSESSRVTVSFKIENGKALFEIHDNGIGIFRKIQDTLKLEDPREAILHLSKGKFTTDPTRHSGEGIFFTSRAFDVFIISSDGLSFIRHAEDDWLFKSVRGIKGTRVEMEIALKSERTLLDLFRRYTDRETMTFAKTHVVVDLAQKPGEIYISRSQAKRVLAGLEKFKDVVLDFKGVPAVGQGFVDEIFRVFQLQHPDVKITWVHAHPDVEFMIQRAKA